MHPNATYPNLVLVAVLALTGLTNQPSWVHDVVPLASPVVEASLNRAFPPGVTLEELGIAVPPVDGAGRVLLSDQVLSDLKDADVVVADNVVNPARVESDIVAADGFQTIGVTWPEGTEVRSLGGQVRSRSDGQWTPWVDLEPGDNAPDAGTADADRALRGGTDSVWIGDAEAVQLAFATTVEGGPEGLSLALIGSEQVPAVDGIVGTPSKDEAVLHPTSLTSQPVQTAVGSAPRVISRAEWGAPTQTCTPDVASALLGAVLHHTAGPNSYANTEQARQQIRNDANYHIGTRGWCDIGYNFIVDKWGNIYEGRANSLVEPVIGVHTGGFNTGTLGVAMLGTYDAPPSDATLRGVASIIGWRLGSAGVDPNGRMTYYTGGGENSRYTNQNVSLPRIFGHRDTAFTACPGQGGWQALDRVRALAGDAVPARIPNLVRTTTDSTVYLITPSGKLPISDFPTYTSLSVLGPLGYVSQSFLDGKKTGPSLGRFIRSRDGSIYLFDDGVRYPVPSCAMISAFGRSCAEYASMELSDAQIALFPLGVRLSTTISTRSGGIFVVGGGLRREASNSAALESVAADVSVTLSEHAIANLGYGVPILVGNSVAVDRSSSAKSVIVGGMRYPVANGFAEETALGHAFASVTLDGPSLDALPQGRPITGLLASAAGTRFAVLPAGKTELASGFGLALPVTAVPDVLLAAIPDVAVPSGTFFLKSAGESTVYLVSDGRKRSIGSMQTVFALLEHTNPFFYSVAGSAEVANLATGYPVLEPGSVVKSPSASTLYLVDGLRALVPIRSMEMLARFGEHSWSAPGENLLTGYAVGSALSTAVRCDAAPFVLVGGVRIGVGGDGFGLNYRDLGPSTCSTLPRSSAVISGELFVKPSGSATVYVVRAGVKRAVTSMSRLYEINRGNPNLIIVTMDPSEVSLLPSGPAI